MADKKISALPAASTPLAGTEVLPIVQSGSTVKVSVANLTAGRSITASGLGVGTSLPQTVAQVTGDVANTDGTGLDQGQLALTDTVESSALVLGYYYQGGVGEYARIQARNSVGATNIIMQAGGGNVGIGTNNPAYQLTLSTDSAAKPTSSLWTIASDSRLKNETGEYTKGLDAVCALRPVTYTYNGAAGFAADGAENISIIAQEAIEHFPECVGTFKAKLQESDENPTDFFNWNGHALIFAVVNAIKELKNLNDALVARVAELEGK